MRTLLFIFYGLSSGLLVAAGVFSFIATIGIVPRMAQRTQTKTYIRLYEDVIVAGGFAGSIAMFWDFSIPMHGIIFSIIGFLEGCFIGVLAMAVAEVLNVMPIFMRRSGLKIGLPLLVLAFALGKSTGSLLYYLLDGFYEI